VRFFVPQPIPEIRMMREVFAFDAQARLGLLEVTLRECGASLGWGRHGGDLQTLSNETKACILSTVVGETAAALWKTRQALATKRTHAERAAYAEGMRRVSSCSEFMLRPGAGVWRSSRYATNLAAWYGAFPREQIKVIATEEMEREPRRIMTDVYRFLGLPDAPAEPQPQPQSQPKPPPKPPPQKSLRLCVVGKAMAEDEAPATNLAWRAGRLDASSDEGGNGGVALGPCVPRTESEAKVGKDGVSRYEIDSETEALLRRYFVPHNAKLFALLGRRLPWAEVEEKPIEVLACALSAGGGGERGKGGERKCETPL